MRYFLFALSALVLLWAASSYSNAAARNMEAISLQTLQKNVAPRFKQLSLKNDGDALAYHLFIPRNRDQGKKYPLVVYFGNGHEPQMEYGALIFASAQAQQKNPCYVLVPQLLGVAVDDEYKPTKGAESLPHMVRSIANLHPINVNRIYVTGQGTGGMLAMYFNTAAPDLAAASLFAGGRWDTENLNPLLKNPFIYIYDAHKGEAMKKALEEAARKRGKSYTWSEWSAKLPLATQNNLAATMLGKDQPINIFGFESGTLPEDGLDRTYQLASLRNWLFRQSLAKTRK